MKTNTIQEQAGGNPKGTLSPLAPRQRLFMEYYLNADSPSFGNCYASAVRAGYTDQTARNLMHLRPSWLSETIGQNTTLEPADLLARLAQIIDDRRETTTNKLRAIDMMMKHYQMFGAGNITAVQLNIQNVLD
jgi:hypothetical protein